MVWPALGLLARPMPGFGLGLAFCVNDILAVGPGNQPARCRCHATDGPAGRVQPGEGIIGMREGRHQSTALPGSRIPGFQRLVVWGNLDLRWHFNDFG